MTATRTSGGRENTAETGKSERMACFMMAGMEESDGGGRSGKRWTKEGESGTGGGVKNKAGRERRYYRVLAWICPEVNSALRTMGVEGGRER